MTNSRRNGPESSPPTSDDAGGLYAIKVKGTLDEHWNQWFEGMTLSHIEESEMGQEYTLITGPVVDQPQLHGLLAKIRDLNLILISVKKVNSRTSKRKKASRDIPKLR